MQLAPADLFQPYDAIILTETFLTSEWRHRNFYSIHSLAKQGLRERPKGGITILPKAKLSPFKVIQRSDNIMIVETKLGTIIGTYFQPEYKEEDIIDELASALQMI